MPDQIELRGLRASGICGVLPEEQQRPQPLEVDVVIDADLGPASVSDDLADTVDYSGVVATVEQIITSERFMLLERLAGRLADAVLEVPGAEAVTVSVRKLRPPVSQQLDTTGVSLTRRSPG